MKYGRDKLYDELQIYEFIFLFVYVLTSFDPWSIYNVTIYRKFRDPNNVYDVLNFICSISRKKKYVNTR